MNRARYFVTYTLLLMLTACVSLEAPKSFNDRLVYAYTAVTAARDTSTALLERKRISKDQAVNLLELANQARASLDIARGAFSTGDVATAEGQLTLATTILTQLEAFLQARAK